MSYIDNETTQKVMAITNTTASNKKLDELLKNLRAFNNRLSSSTNDITKNEMQLKRLEELNLSADDIRQDAENELYDYKKTTQENIINQSQAKEKELVINKDKLQKNYADAKEKTQDYYGTIKENASNDALKRGLARSSIVINTLDAFNKDEIENYNVLNKELTDSLNEIDFQLSSIDSKQQQALADFDIEYAAKLNKKITDLKKEYHNVQNDIIKYNNQITEAENNFNLKYAELEKTLQNSNWDKEVDLIELSGKFGVNVIERYKQNQMFSIISNQLHSANEEEKSAILNSPEIASMLSQEQLDKLLKQFGAK